jgi:hypothetical protein
MERNGLPFLHQAKPSSHDRLVFRCFPQVLKLCVLFYWFNYVLCYVLWFIGLPMFCGFIGLPMFCGFIGVTIFCGFISLTMFYSRIQHINNHIHIKWQGRAKKKKIIIIIKTLLYRAIFPQSGLKALKACLKLAPSDVILFYFLFLYNTVASMSWRVSMFYFHLEKHSGLCCRDSSIAQVA